MTYELRGEQKKGKWFLMNYAYIVEKTLDDDLDVILSRFVSDKARITSPDKVVYSFLSKNLG